MRRLICLIRGHDRDKARRRKIGGHHYSECLRCGTTLFRDPEGGWRTARDADWSARTIDVAIVPAPDEAAGPPPPHDPA